MNTPDMTPEQTEQFAAQVDAFIEAVLPPDTIPKEIAEIAEGLDDVLQNKRNDHTLFAMVLVMKHLTSEMDDDACAIALAGFAKMVMMLRSGDDDDGEVQVAIVVPT